MLNQAIFHFLRQVGVLLIHFGTVDAEKAERDVDSQNRDFRSKILPQHSERKQSLFNNNVRKVGV